MVMANFARMLVICLVAVIPCCAASEVEDDNPFQPASLTCAVNGTLKEARIKAIKDTILAKLHLSEEPGNPTRPVLVKKSTYSAYEAAVQTARYRAEQPPQECRRETFFAKLIHVYVPNSYVPVIPPADLFDWGEQLRICTI